MCDKVLVPNSRLHSASCDVPCSGIQSKNAEPPNPRVDDAWRPSKVPQAIPRHDNMFARWALNKTHGMCLDGINAQKDTYDSVQCGRCPMVVAVLRLVQSKLGRQSQPKWADVGRFRHVFARSTPRANLVDVGRRCAKKIEPMREELGSSSTEFERTWRNVGQVWPRFGPES